MNVGRLQSWTLLARTVLVPLLLIGLALFALREPVWWWLNGEEIYDQEAIREWLREARVYNTLPESLKTFLLAARSNSEQLRLNDHPALVRGFLERHRHAREEIHENLKALGTPTTQIYMNQLPLFPVIYQLRVTFSPEFRQQVDARLDLNDIFWDSQIPRHESQVRSLNIQVASNENEASALNARVTVLYHLHAYQQRQTKERQEATRRLFLGGLGVLFTLAFLVWVYLIQRREYYRQQRQVEAEQRLHEAQRRHFEEELRRQEAEAKQQAAERQALELKSQLFANIGIMAGSYAHNIKNLLVRPNDLLRRCLEENPNGENQHQMISEVKQTLGTVTQRLQQILQTVRRDPSQAETSRFDIHGVLQDLFRTWVDLAREKWKLSLEIDLAREPNTGETKPFLIEGDLSHLQQAFENLLFNARDATFEMRNQMREAARKESASDPKDALRKQAIIAAAAWKGRVLLRTRQDADGWILEVQDNGIGMTEEVRRRCTETHFSTKRNNALFAGLSAGMGLGLSFVTVILGHHGASLEIVTAPLQGATFRIRFPRGPRPSLATPV